MSNKDQWVRFGVKFYDVDRMTYKEWVMAPDYKGCQQICSTIVSSSLVYMNYAIVYPPELIPNNQ